MISYIQGELAALEDDKIIVDVGGVGYGIYMSAQTMSLLPRPGSQVKIHTYMNVKEDCMQLFGFLTGDDLQVFKLVIGVNGIGPKGGLSILSQLTPDDLRFAVVSNDVKAICAAPGIGKKTAEKLILELKDKLSIEDVLEKGFSDENNSQVQSGNSEIQQDTVQALIALGYGSTEALKAVKQVEITEGMNTESVLRQALKHMMF